MADKLGFTFYPKDWWTSDSFFEFNEFERYIYLECMFLMYSNDGCIKTQKTQIENRTRTQISDEVWAKISSKFIITDNGFSLPSVNKRLKKTLTNRENGKKGGRPTKEEKPKKPKLETQKNPPLESERESEGERELLINRVGFSEIEKTILESMMHTGLRPEHAKSVWESFKSKERFTVFADMSHLNRMLHNSIKDGKYKDLLNGKETKGISVHTGFKPTVG